MVREVLVAGVWRLVLAEDRDTIRLPGIADRNGDGHIVDDLIIVEQIGRPPFPFS